MKATIERLPWMMPIVLTALVLFTNPRPVLAQSSCFQDLRDCYGRAAIRTDWWDIWAAGIDCELTFADCVRRSIVGR